MVSFVHRKNIERFRALLAETTDETERQLLLKLLADEEQQELDEARQPFSESMPKASLGDLA
ncbi:MAG TPA: hypothetical protein VFK79_08685 [Xanthobacteraceae bacterium]|nr:hypothetical protein [Xanthobacteraceae bacterium]